MKKLILPAIIGVFIAFMFTSTSCNDRVCVRCYKIGDSTDIKDYCNSDPNKRNDWVVEQTHADYSCANVEE